MEGSENHVVIGNNVYGIQLGNHNCAFYIFDRNNYEKFKEEVKTFGSQEFPWDPVFKSP